MKREYGDSIRFRLLKWLHPLMMLAVFAGFCHLIYFPHYSVEFSWWVQFLIWVSYLLINYNLEKTYHGLSIGLLRITELIYSQTLSSVISTGFMYLVFSLYKNRFLLFWPLLAILAVQFLFSTGWTLIANALYYHLYQAPKTALVYRKESDLYRIESIRYFHDHFDVRKTIENPDDDAAAILDQLKDVEVVIAAGINAELRNRIAKYCVESNITGYFIPRLGDIIMAGAEHMPTFGQPVMQVRRANVRNEYIAIKRFLDMLISFLGILIASPFMLATAIAIKAHDGGPVFYRQTRLTQNGRPFSILKFRSMKVDAEKDGVARLASENDQRITPIGKIIRAIRLDELPQLFNILIGDMSLVGPRPERPEIAAEYAQELPEFSLRLQVKAGLTGMAQVYGRYNTEPYSKLQMDLMYINQMSLITDIKLLFYTVKILFVKESTEGIEEGRKNALLAGKKAKTERRSA